MSKIYWILMIFCFSTSRIKFESLLEKLTSLPLSDDAMQLSQHLTFLSNDFHVCTHHQQQGFLIFHILDFSLTLQFPSTYFIIFLPPSPYTQHRLRVLTSVLCTFLTFIVSLARSCNRSTLITQKLLLLPLFPHALPYAFMMKDIFVPVKYLVTLKLVINLLYL